MCSTGVRRARALQHAEEDSEFHARVLRQLNLLLSNPSHAGVPSSPEQDASEGDRQQLPIFLHSQSEPPLLVPITLAQDGRGDQRIRVGRIFNRQGAAIAVGLVGFALLAGWITKGEGTAETSVISRARAHYLGLLPADLTDTRLSDAPKGWASARENFQLAAVSWRQLAVAIPAQTTEPSGKLTVLNARPGLYFDVVVRTDEPEVPFPLHVDRADTASPLQKIEVIGLPPFASLSEGRRTANDRWVINPSRLDELRLHFGPVVLPRPYHIEIRLLDDNGQILAETQTRLRFIHEGERKITSPSDSGANAPPTSMMATSTLATSRAAGEGLAQINDTLTPADARVEQSGDRGKLTTAKPPENPRPSPARGRKAKESTRRSDTTDAGEPRRKVGVGSSSSAGLGGPSRGHPRTSSSEDAPTPALFPDKLPGWSREAFDHINKP